MTTECRNCGSAVTRRFARVFGDNDDRVHACLDCANTRAIQNGAAAGQSPKQVTMI